MLAKIEPASRPALTADPKRPSSRVLLCPAFFHVVPCPELSEL